MPLLWISLAFIAGLVLGNALPWAAPSWFSLTAALALLGLLARLPRLPAGLNWLSRREPRLFLPPILLALALTFGAGWMGHSAPDTAGGHIAGFNDQGVMQIVAVVEAPPDLRDRTSQLRLRVEEVTPLDAQSRPGKTERAHGTLLAVVAGRTGLAYGDRLGLTGKLVTPPEGETFSYRDYLARQGVYSYLTYPRARLLEHDAASPIKAAIYRLRDWAYAEVFHLFPAPEAPLLAGILLGIENDMPEGLARAFQDTGTAHVIAISGFNIAILAELFSRLFGRLCSRFWATGLAILAISAYTLMVGATPSVVRAAVMGSMGLVAHQIGRRSTGANSLAFTAALMCLGNPRLPWDPSFQLSFMATLGLILYGNRLQDGFTGLLERHWPAETARKIAGPVGEYVLMTLAAQLLTLPVILYHFQRLSISSLLANPLILPPQPLVMTLSGAAVLAGLIFDPLAHLLAWLAWPLSAYTIRMVEALARMPGGVLVLGEMNLWAVGLMYAAALAPALNKRFPALLKQTLTPSLLMIGLGLAAAVAARGVMAAPDGRLHLLVFDLDGSQAVLVRGPEGQALLINGGPSTRLLNDALDRWLSPFDRRLDGLLLNTPESAAYNGLSGMLETHPLGALWWGVEPPDNRTVERLVETLHHQQTLMHALSAGEALSLGGNARVEAAAVSPQGSALLLHWDNFRALIPGGTPPSRLPDSLAQPSLLILDVRDLEKTTAKEWQAIAPQAVILTPGMSEVPDQAGWLITQPQGWFRITTDGEKVWIETK